MLRVCGQACGASTSKVAFFHTSSSNLSRSSKLLGARNKKKNIARAAELIEQASRNRPSVVLGTRAAEEAEKWANCKLAQILVSDAELEPPTILPSGEVDATTAEPKALGYGVTEDAKQLIFEDLPEASASTITKLYNQRSQGFLTVEMGKTLRTVQKGPSSMLEGAGQGLAVVSKVLDQESKKTTLVAQALDLRNANAAGIAFENRRRIITAFSTPQNPYDTGRTEVQVALLTYKIRKLWQHLVEFKSDIANRRSLRKLIHQRGALLRYLKREDRDRYETILQQVALEPQSVEGELVV